MIPRTLEPIPDDPRAEAELYLAMDHREVNMRFVEDLLAGGPIGNRVIDMGCGPALIAILLCERCEGLDEHSDQAACHDLQVMAIDLDIEMLELARFEIEMASRVGQIQLQQVDITDPDGLQEEIADCVFSNTVLHHLEEPGLAVGLALKSLKPGGRLFVRDLCRPDTEKQLEALVVAHGQPENADPALLSAEQIAGQTQLFRQSLHAALTIGEAQAMVEAWGLPGDCVRMTSDRHWTLDARKPPNQLS